MFWQDDIFETSVCRENTFTVFGITFCFYLFQVIINGVNTYFPEVKKMVPRNLTSLLLKIIYETSKNIISHYIFFFSCEISVLF